MSMQCLSRELRQLWPVAEKTFNIEREFLPSNIASDKNYFRPTVIDKLQVMHAYGGMSIVTKNCVCLLCDRRPLNRRW